VNQRLILLSIAILILVSLLAGPALAATVTCPSSCSCLLPAEAAKINTPGLCGGKQTVCASDGKTTKYCYLKPVTTTTVVPQFIVTGHVFTPTTVPAFVKCSPDCSCEYEPEGEIRHLTLCGGTQYLCGMDPKGVPKYCYVRPPPTPLNIVPALTGVTLNNSVMPAVPPTTLPKPPVSHTVTPTATTPAPAGTGSCAPGCSCLSSDKADAAGFKRCSESQKPCGYDPRNIAKYCYIVDQGLPADGAPVDIPSLHPSDGSLPALPASDGSPPAIERKTTTPVPSDNAPPDLFASIGTFFSALFGGSKTPATAGPVNSQVRGCAGFQTLCDGNCTDTSSDRANCGRCGTGCLGSEQCCNGVCTSIYSNADNCGGCGRTCPAGLLCTNYACSNSACREGLTTCSGACVDTRYDLRNCGSCGHICPSGQHCVGGDCYGCGVGTTACDVYPGSACFNLQTDRTSCGSCRNRCGTNEICSNGTCTSCPSGTTACTLFNMSSACTDLTTSEDNCGSCRNACWLYGDTFTCVNGQCRSPTSLAGGAAMSRGGES
jgi:hypothetical protein